MNCASQTPCCASQYIRRQPFAQQRPQFAPDQMTMTRGCAPNMLLAFLAFGLAARLTFAAPAGGVVTRCANPAPNTNGFSVNDYVGLSGGFSRATMCNAPPKIGQATSCAVSVEYSACLFLPLLPYCPVHSTSISFHASHQLNTPRFLFVIPPIIPCLLNPFSAAAPLFPRPPSLSLPDL